MRNSTPLGPYSRTMPRALWWPQGGGLPRCPFPPNVLSRTCPLQPTPASGNLVDTATTLLVRKSSGPKAFLGTSRRSFCFQRVRGLTATNAKHIVLPGFGLGYQGLGQAALSHRRSAPALALSNQSSSMNSVIRCWLSSINPIIRYWLDQISDFGIC